MRYATLVCLLIVFFAVPLAPTIIAAQDTSTAPWTGPTPRIRPGQTIWVTTSDRRELTGSVRSVSASMLEITGPSGELSIPFRDVRMIQARDSSNDGACYGAIIGGASLGIYFGLLSSALRCERDCGTDYSSTRDTIGAVAFGAGVGAGTGALVGVLVDHLVKGRQVVYAASPTEPSAWEISPVVAKEGLRVFARMRW